MMWVSGSLIASMMVLSSSVSRPSISSRACFWHAIARSRTTRGNLAQTFPIGCIRVFMTPSCSSVVIRLSRCEVAWTTGSSLPAVCCRIWFRASTSSPTRFISRSSNSTSTRMLLSAAVAADGSGADGTDGADEADEADGADGTDEADGTDGTDGADGADGADGTGSPDSVSLAALPALPDLSALS